MHLSEIVGMRASPGKKWGTVSTGYLTAMAMIQYNCSKYMLIHANSFGGNIGPEEKFLREVVVKCNDALLSVNYQVIVAGVQPQFTKVVTVRKQQKRFLAYKYRSYHQPDCFTEDLWLLETVVKRVRIF